MIYLPEEEIVQLDIAVIGSGDCSFHPLDKLLLCLNIHFWDLKTNNCLYFVSFKIYHSVVDFALNALRMSQNKKVTMKKKLPPPPAVLLAQVISEPRLELSS